MSMRIVVDTNVIISGLINPHGPPGKVIAGWESGIIVPCWSLETLAELEVVARRPKLIRAFRNDTERLNAVIRVMQERGELVAIQPTPEPLIPADPKDDKFLSTAVAAGADAIVSGDEHLLAMGHYRGIPIVSPSAILEEIDRWPG